MTKVPRLKIVLWQEIIYLIFVAIIPVILTSIKFFNVGHTRFTFSFASLGSILIVAIVLRKFVFGEYIKTLQGRIIMLEHDYEIGNGIPSQIEVRWAKFNAVCYGYNAIMIAVSLALFAIFVGAISSGLLEFKKQAILILASVLIGLVFKLLLYLRRLLK